MLPPHNWRTRSKAKQPERCDRSTHDAQLHFAKSSRPVSVSEPTGFAGTSSDDPGYKLRYLLCKQYDRTSYASCP